jgi:alpha-beta hydrolase superfamily lysophospholipase
MHGSFLVRTAGTQAINQLGAHRPYQAIPRNVSGLYGRSLHADHGGEWTYDLAWKPIESWPVYAGWLRAIRRGHAAIHKGLALSVPTLVLSSAASLQPREWEPAVDESDTVLDVALMAKWVHKLSSHVTLVQVPGALHDVTLSRQPARDRVYDELGRWVGAYAD